MRVLLVFAHPDDETFSSSGTVISYSKRGHEIKLVMATRGEAGMLGDPPHVSREKLGAEREKELREAAKLTGISDIYFLDYIDGTLENIPHQELTDKVLSHIYREKPHVVITFEKNGITLHPDHRAISKAATAAFAKYMKGAKHPVQLYHICLPASHVKTHQKAGFKYEHFGKMTGTPDDEITMAVDITSVYNDKIKAMKKHKTQKKDYEMILKRNKLIPGPKYEHFKLVAENRIKKDKTV